MLVFLFFLWVIPSAFSIDWRGTRGAHDSPCLKALIIPRLEERISQGTSPVWLGRLYELELLLRRAGASEIRAKNLVSEILRFASGNHRGWIHPWVQDVTRGIQLAQKDSKFLVCILGQDCSLNFAELKQWNTISHAENYSIDDFLVADIRTHSQDEMRLDLQRDPAIRAGLGHFAGLVTLPNPPQQALDSEDAEWIDAFYHEMSHTYDRRLVSAWINANKILIKSGQGSDRLFKAFVIDVDGVSVLSHVFFHTFSEIRAYAVGIYAGRWISGKNITRFSSVDARRSFLDQTTDISISYEIILNKNAGIPFDPLDKYPELAALGAITALSHGDDFMDEEEIDVNTAFSQAMNWTTIMRHTISRAGLTVP